MKYQTGQASRLGNREVNEDRIGMAETENAVLLVLADGMGGYRGGQLASKTLVNKMLHEFKKSQFPTDDPRKYLKELVSNAHLAVICAGNEQYPPIEPRTTCVVCLIQDGQAWWAHVGDSRLYLFRGRGIHDRTIDHSKIEEMRRKGKLSEKEMEKHPQRHLITRCVGFQQHPPVPGLSAGVVLKENDILLLCSDGLWGSVNENDILSMVFNNSIDQAVESLAYQAEFKAFPESDNISVIAFRWFSEDLDEEAKELEQSVGEPGEASRDELTDTLDELDKALEKNE